MDGAGAFPGRGRAGRKESKGCWIPLSLKLVPGDSPTPAQTEKNLPGK